MYITFMQVNCSRLVHNFEVQFVCTLDLAELANYHPNSIAVVILLSLITTVLFINTWDLLVSRSRILLHIGRTLWHNSFRIRSRYNEFEEIPLQQRL